METDFFIYCPLYESEEYNLNGHKLIDLSEVVAVETFPRINNKFEIQISLKTGNHICLTFNNISSLYTVYNTLVDRLYPKDDECNTQCKPGCSNPWSDPDIKVEYNKL